MIIIVVLTMSTIDTIMFIEIYYEVPFDNLNTARFPSIQGSQYWHVSVNTASITSPFICMYNVHETFK